MRNQAAEEQIIFKYNTLAPLMDERMRRQWAATEAKSYGRGGLHAVSIAIQMSPNTIRKGIQELAQREKNPKHVIDSRVRRSGGGRKKSVDADPGLNQELKRLVEPMTRGDPMSPLLCSGLV